MACAGGVYDSVFNNFLSDTFHLSADGRGGLELPREFPGFMVVVMAGLLGALAVTRLGMVAAIGYSAGLAGLAIF